MIDPYLELFSVGRHKTSVVAAPGGIPAPPPPPPGQPPMDPSMMAPPGGPPMDPSMMAPPGMDPNAPPMQPPSVEEELATIKSMVQQLMDAQLAMMQAMAPPAGMDPSMMAPPGPPMDPSMMPPPGPPGMDPAAMGLPPAPPPGMVAQASSYTDDDLTKYVKTITDLLR